MLATPFHEDESIDSASMANLVDKAISSGCQGMVCLGVTGEVARLTDHERHQVAETVIQRAEGYPVTVGTTAASTAAAIQHSKNAQDLGAAAVMVSPPTDGQAKSRRRVRSLLTAGRSHRHSHSVVQDYPSTSGVHMSPEFIQRLSGGIPAAQYLKLEDPADAPPRYPLSGSWWATTCQYSEGWAAYSCTKNWLAVPPEQ